MLNRCPLADGPGLAILDILTVILMRSDIQIRLFIPRISPHHWHHLAKLGLVGRVLRLINRTLSRPKENCLDAISFYSNEMWTPSH